MTTDQIVYSVFGVVILIALTLDLGFLSKKNTTITIRQAMRQTFLWVLLALGFFVFMWVEEGQKLAFEYLSGYLMEFKY
jgi:tellurite resistance protein TerC